MSIKFSDLKSPVPEGAERIHSLRELDIRRGINPEQVAEQLGLEGASKLNFIGNAYRAGSCLKVAREAPVLEYLGAEPAHPYRMLNETDVSQGVQRQLIEQLGQVRFRVRAEKFTEEGGIQFFPAHFRDVPSFYFDKYETGLGVSHVVMMQLPQRDWETIQCSLGPVSSLRYPDCFAFVGYDIEHDGAVKVYSARSEVFEHIVDDSLKDKYANWREVLLTAFFHHLQLRESNRVYYRQDDWKLKDLFPRRIVLGDLSESMNAEQIIFAAIKAIKGEAKEPESLVRMRALCRELDDTAEALKAKFGFKETLEWVRADPEGGRKVQYAIRRTFERDLLPLARDSYRASDSTWSLCFEADPEPRFGEMFQIVDTVFPPDVYSAATDYGYLTGRAHTPTRWQGADLEQVRRHFELACADPYDFSHLPIHLSEREIECLLRGRERAEARVARSLIGDHHMIISKARLTEGSEDVWRIPQAGVSEITATHMAHQNRHPYLRCSLVAEDGETFRFVIGFKGAGAKCVKQPELLHDTDGFELPLHYNFKESLREEGKEKGKSPAPQPKLWGGEEVDDCASELTRTLSLRRFLEEHAPHLVELIPLPFDVRRYLEIPAWKDGQTHWFGAYEYEQKFFGGYYSNMRHPGAYISIQRCDIRLRQMVERLFTRTEASASDLSLAGQEIESALQAFFWWNGEDTTLATEGLVAAARTLRLPKLLATLAQEARSNPERTERMYEKTALRLAEIVGFVHGAGGHFGGGWRRVNDEITMGTSFGGPLGMRNIDLAAGLHDFDLHEQHFPWSKNNHSDWEHIANQETEIERSRLFDLMYLGEALHWFDLIIHGRTRVRADTPLPQSFAPNQFNDLYLLQLESTTASNIRALSEALTLRTDQLAHEGVKLTIDAPILALLERRAALAYAKGLGLGASIKKWPWPASGAM